MDTPSGVVAPVIPRANDLSLDALASLRKELVGRARENRLAISELQGATITVSNIGGGFGVDQMTPLLTPPQVVAIGVGRSQSRDEMSTFAATFVGDHRALDGGDGARFLSKFEEAFASVVESLAGKRAH